MSYFLTVTQQVGTESHHLLTDLEFAGDPRRLIADAQYLHRAPGDR